LPFPYISLGTWRLLRAQAPAARWSLLSLWHLHVGNIRLRFQGKLQTWELGWHHQSPDERPINQSSGTRRERRKGCIGLLYASAPPNDIRGHRVVLSRHPCGAAALAMLPSQSFCDFWMIKMESGRKQSWHGQAVTLLEGPDVPNQGSLWLLMRKKQNRAVVRFKGFGKRACVVGLTAFDGYQMASRKGRTEPGGGHGEEAQRGRRLERSFVSLCREMSRVKGAYIHVYVNAYVYIGK